MNRLQQLTAHGFAGIVLAAFTGTVGGCIGYVTSEVTDAQMDEYFLHLPLLFTKSVGTLWGSLVGAGVGFPAGVLANVFWQSRRSRLHAAKPSRPAEGPESGVEGQRRATGEKAAGSER